MHELSLATSLLRRIDNESEQQGFQLVASMFLEIGPFSCVDDDALLFAIQTISPGTCIDGAQIHIQRVTGELRCHQCGNVFETDDRFSPCPTCASIGGTINNGDQAMLTALDVVPTAIPHVLTPRAQTTNTISKDKRYV